MAEENIKSAHDEQTIKDFDRTNCSVKNSELSLSALNDAAGFMGKNVVNERSLRHRTPQTAVEVNENMQSYLSGINLRKWLESNYCLNASKNERLELFKKIVEIVDVQHSQGIALMELRPSSFILYNTGVVKYTGSLMKTELWSHNTKKTSGLEPDEKMQKVGKDKASCFLSGFIRHGSFDVSTWLTSDNLQLEKHWYAFPEGLKIRDLCSSNIYSLGLLLFEFLCDFDSIEAHSATILDLQLHHIFPPYFLSECSKEAEFCSWLLHPEASSRPTTRKILQSELISGNDIVDDVESDVLLHDFLVSSEQDMQNKASNLLQSVEVLDAEIKVIEGTVKDQGAAGCSASVVRDKLLLGNIISELQNMNDPSPSSLPAATTREDNTPSLDRLGTFFDGICKFGRYNKFEECGTIQNSDILNSRKRICSLSFDRDEHYIATADQVSKKIKIYEFDSLLELDSSTDVHYPIFEISSKSKLTCISWNKYIKNYLASTDYYGLVQMWDTNTGQGVAQYNEHQNIVVWSVDFSQVDPMKFATGGNDRSVKIWNINERNSICTIRSPHNVGCVQFSPYSSHIIAFGSRDFNLYCYDLRHTKKPWCTLTGHDRAVSHVEFLDSENVVSASLDNTLKLWDLNKTTLNGLSLDACILTYRGHTNVKNFVGLTVLDGYIACGSKTNEVYAYYKSLPMPSVCHKLGYVDPFSGQENTNGENISVTSVRWRRKSQMLVVGDSKGTVKILRMV